MEEARKVAMAWQLTTVKSKKKAILEAQKEQRTVHFCYANGHLSLQKMQSWSRTITNVKAGLCSEHLL